MHNHLNMADISDFVYIWVITNDFKISLLKLENNLKIKNRQLKLSTLPDYIQA